jgi:hypothetical protein
MLLCYRTVDVTIFQLEVIAANDEEAFAEAGDASVSSRRSETDTFLYYRLEPG